MYRNMELRYWLVRYWVSRIALLGVKNSIPYSKFLRLRRLCSDESDFSLKSEEMCNFFNKGVYPAR